MSKEQAIQIMSGLFVQLFKQGQVAVTPETYSGLQEAWNVIEQCLLTEIPEPTPNANGTSSTSSLAK